MNMTNEQILKKVIEKAVENGYKDKLFWVKDLPEIGEHDLWAYSAWKIRLIFSHSFAKAFCITFSKISGISLFIFFNEGGSS